MFSVKICFASSTVFPTKFGIATSLGLLAFEIPIVNPNVITNNKIKPTIDDKTLWFFINCANLLGFLLENIVSKLYVNIILINYSGGENDQKWNKETIKW